LCCISFLIAVGVLGGLASFGMVGLFVGPVILAVLLAIWREWLHEQVNEPLMMPKATLAYDPPEEPLDTPKK
jgi:predicted PurR-regulated permease PerM